MIENLNLIEKTQIYLFRYIYINCRKILKIIYKIIILILYTYVLFN